MTVLQNLHATTVLHSLLAMTASTLCPILPVLTALAFLWTLARSHALNLNQVHKIPFVAVSSPSCTYHLSTNLIAEVSTPPPSSSTSTSTTDTTTTRGVEPPTPSSCNLDITFRFNSTRDSEDSVENVEYYLSSPTRGLSWYRADSLATSLHTRYQVEADREDWRLAEVSTQPLVQQLEAVLRRRGCKCPRTRYLDNPLAGAAAGDPATLSIWLGATRLGPGGAAQWAWSRGDAVTGELWATSPGAGLHSAAEAGRAW